MMMMMPDKEENTHQTNDKCKPEVKFGTVFNENLYFV